MPVGNGNPEEGLYWSLFTIVLCCTLTNRNAQVAADIEFDPNAIDCAVNPCLNGGTCINILATKDAHGYENPVMCSGRRCYEFVRNPSNWQEASLSCLAKSATLVALETEEEMDVIKSYIIDNELYVTTSDKIDGFWTGGNDIAREGAWMWSGLDRSVTSWQPKPSATWGNPRVQNCLELNTEYLENYDFRWKASQCSERKYFICETSIQQVTAERTYQCLCHETFEGYHCEHRTPDAQQFRNLACDNSVLTLQCPSNGDNKVNVLTADYGRWPQPNPSLCITGDVNSESSMDTCRFNSSRARHAVSVFCNGRQECSFIVSSSTMGFMSDICPGVVKYADIFYECRAPNTLPIIECERDRGQRISCERNPDKPYIFIEYASYGRLAVGICTSVQGVSTGACRSMSSLAVVSEWCNGKSACILEADNVYFGDPCTGVYKYLQVRYRCVDQVPRREWYPHLSGFPTIDSPEYCETMSMDGITWPKTRHGHTAAAVCPADKEGLAYMQCLSHPAHWNPRGADFSSCVSGWVNEANEKIHNNIPAAEIAASVDEETDDEDSLNSKDIEDTVTIISDLLQLQKTQMLVMDDNDKGRNTRNFTEEVFSVGSNLLERENVAKWIQIPGDHVSTSATKLVHNLEESAMLLANQLQREDKVNLKKENIVMQAMSLPTGGEQRVDPVELNLDVVNEGKHENRQAIVTLPNSILKPRDNENEYRKMAFLAYNNLEDLLTSKVAFQENGDPVDNEGNELANMSVNTMVVAVSIDGEKPTRLDGELRIVIEHLKEYSGDNSTCAFWNYSESDMEKGNWSTDGCYTISTNATHTECACDHLTNFAVLMDVHGTVLSDSHTVALNVISYIGCIISIVCLAICIVVFSCFRSLWCVRNSIHRNLCICLMIAELLFIIGINRTESKILCSVFAGLLHYFFLASFTWMCLEGIQLYIMLVLVFAQEKSRIYLYYLFGYGVPSIIVGVSVGIRYDGYGTEFYCWLTTEHYLIWSFVGPVAAIAVVNIVFLVMALRVAYAHRTIAVKEEGTVTHKVRMWAKGAVILVCILGVTWITGLMFVNEDSVIVAYVFTVLNSFQGLFIFIFHCVLNDKVTTELDKRMRRSTRVPNFIRDKYAARFPQSSGQVVSSTVPQSQGAKHGESVLSVTSTISESVEISQITTNTPRSISNKRSREYVVS